MTEIPLGLIAGSKGLPLLFAREARNAQRRVAAVAFEGETDPELAKLVDSVEWVRVGQLGRMIESLRSRGVVETVMLGQIAPGNLFNLRPDLRALKLLAQIREKNAHSLFGAIALELAKDGVHLIDPTPWLRPWMPEPGVAVGRALDAKDREDINLGLRLAKEVSRLEIGQTVVVKAGAVLAIEAFEGTDACLERGGGLAGRRGGAVAVKVAKEGHDMRFDIPCIGDRTLETAAKHGVSVLATEGGRTLWLDRDTLQAQARRRGVSVVSV